MDRPRLTVLVHVRCALCVVCCVFVGKECLLLCGVSDDRRIGFSFVRWLFGGCMVGLLVVLFVPLLLSFLAMPGLCRFLRVTLHMAFVLCFDFTPGSNGSGSSCFKVDVLLLLGVLHGESNRGLPLPRKANAQPNLV